MTTIDEERDALHAQLAHVIGRLYAVECQRLGRTVPADTFLALATEAIRRALDGAGVPKHGLRLVPKDGGA